MEHSLAVVTAKAKRTDGGREGGGAGVEERRASLLGLFRLSLFLHIIIILFIVSYLLSEY